MISRKSGGRVLDDKGLVDEFVAKELSRRQMVRATMLGAVGTWLGATGLAACGSPMTGSDVVTPGDSQTPVDAVQPMDTAPMPTPHLVGMGYHETSQEQAFLAALEQTIGLGMINRGDSVYLKVNTNSGDPFPYSTSPELILQLGGMLRDLGVTDLRIGDRSFWGDRNTAGNFEDNGIAQAARTLGTEAIVFDPTNIAWVTLPAETVPNWVGTVRLPEPVTTATHIINMPCMKTHFISTFTMALKNCLGLVHPSDRQRVGNLDTHVASRLWGQIAQVAKGFTPSLNILNGYQALITGGPTPTDGAGGTTADPKVVVVSTDRIATDVTGIAVLQTLSPRTERVNATTPWLNPQIRGALTLGGLGIAGAAAYDLSGPTVPMLETYRGRVMG